jgi:hypothetical protein
MGAVPRAGRDARRRDGSTERDLVPTPLALVLLASSAAALAMAPAVLPRSYSWIEHTTSEAAGQGVPGAWLARSGFVLFGAGVGLVVRRRRGRWTPLAVVAHAGFALSMVAVAVFPSRSWTEAPYDARPDLLHSVAATAMGFCFVIGVVALMGEERRPGRRWGDAVAVGAAIVLPLAMTAWPSSAGASQRVMFLVAYLWYGREVVTWSSEQEVG